MKKLFFFAIIFSLPFGEGWGGAFAQTANEPGSGNCLDFTRSSNDNVQVSNNASLNFGNGSFTIEAWFKLKQTITGTGQNQVLISKGKPANSFTAGYMLRFHWSGGLAAIYSDPVIVGGIYAMAPSNYDDGVWHHTAAVFDKAGSGFIFLYVDGILVASSNISAIGSPDNTANLTFGNAAPSEDPINSLIDEVRIWNRALTQTEIQTYMCSKFPDCADPNLIGYWRFDEGVDNTCSGGQDVCDASCNGNNGVKY